MQPENAGYEYRLPMINALHIEYGARLILVSISLRVRNRQEFPAGQKIPYLDAYFSKAAAPATLSHDAHWNANGHRIAPRAIDEFLTSAKEF